MSLELAFKRLALRPSPLCRQCRRTIGSNSWSPQQSATSAFAESLQSSRNQTATPQTPSRPSPSPPPESTSATRPDAATAQRTSLDLARSAISEANAGFQRREEERRALEARLQYSKADYEAQMTRRWKVGDVYAPHDLSGVEMAKWKKVRRKGRGGVDVVDALGIRPLEHYKNFSIMSEFVTDMGRIKHRNETGLRPVNQRRMAKAVRRAMGMGLIPGVHRHPELIKMDMVRDDGRDRRNRNRNSR